MLAPLFLALVLAQAAPTPDAAGPSAHVDDAPTSTNAGPRTGDTPSGAPADDFAFVNWCKGALSGHMALMASVQPELVSLEHAGKETTDDARLDQEQMAAGREYLELYTRAIEAAEKAGGGDLHARGAAAQAQGDRIWSAARATDARTRMWSWLMWELPARCEIAARKLETRSSLFGEAFKATADPDGASADVAAAPALRGRQ